MRWFGLLVLALIGVKWVVQLWLEKLNAHHLRAHAGAVPQGLREIVDTETYARTAEYTLAKGWLRQLELTYEAVTLVAVLFSGVLPWALKLSLQAFGRSPWAMAAFLFLIGFGLSLLDLPFAWYAQFRLEQRFGFNTSTQELWWMDRLKGVVLGLLLGYPLLVLVLYLVIWTGGAWWLWAWGTFMGFQLLLAVIAPVIILPLFNKFTPLPEGSLRERLFSLARRTQFQAKSIQVMDGSKRSRHSNAFFTGFGKFRKIVLFDTLIQQLAEPELEAVLAHEIGHFKKKHIPKMLVAAALASLTGLYVLSWLAKRGWFYSTFGFSDSIPAVALLVFALLTGTVTFWLSPLAHWWSRRYEYQADSFAASTMGEGGSLVAALRKLSGKNLSNLTPHPLYSGFYYSHPTLIQREHALSQVGA